jgi:hypothetical protein
LRLEWLWTRNLCDGHVWWSWHSDYWTFFLYVDNHNCCFYYLMSYDLMVWKVRLEDIGNDSISVMSYGTCQTCCICAGLQNVWNVWEWNGIGLDNHLPQHGSILQKVDDPYDPVFTHNPSNQLMHCIFLAQHVTSILPSRVAEHGLRWQWFHLVCRDVCCHQAAGRRACNGGAWANGDWF